MKTLGRTAILVACYVFSGYAQQVLACSGAPSTFNKIWYIDPVHGSPPPVGNGTPAHPWNSLQAVVTTTTGYPYPLLTTAPYTYAKVFGQWFSRSDRTNL